MPELKIVENVEAIFATTRLTGCKYDKDMVELIEQGEYLDHTRYKDRFGCTLYFSDASTGLKVALAVYHNPQVIVNGVEIGMEAFYHVVTHCKEGYILFPAETRAVVCEAEDEEIDVVCKRRRFTSLHEFSEYMIYEAPDEPDGVR